MGRRSGIFRLPIDSVALDAAGGPANATAWSAAFAVLVFGILLGPLALTWSKAVETQPGVRLNHTELDTSIPHANGV